MSNLETKQKITYKQPITCPKCGKEAYVSIISCYPNITTGKRLYCIHCEYHEE